MFGKIKKSVLYVAILIAFIASNFIGVGLAQARDNRSDIWHDHEQEGWILISVYYLDHLKYVELAARLATGAGIADELLLAYVKLHVRLYDELHDDELAAAALDKLIASLKDTGAASVFAGDYEFMAKILTYQHWHEECLFGACVEIPEPNTHELVIGVRLRQSNSPPPASTPYEHPTDTIFVDGSSFINGIGSFDAPFTSIAQGAYTVDPSGYLFIEAGDYAETLTLNKNMTISAMNGTVTIGRNASVSSAGVLITGLTNLSNENHPAAQLAEDMPAAPTATTPQMLFLPVVSRSATSPPDHVVQFAVDKTSVNTTAVAPTGQITAAMEPKLYLPVIANQ